MNSLDTKFGLSSQVFSRIYQVLQQDSGIEKVLIFGSRAKGHFKPGSDIDLAIFAPTLKTDDLFKLENQIEELMLPYKFDFVLFHQIENEDLKSHILKVGQTFFPLPDKSQ